MLLNTSSEINFLTLYYFFAGVLPLRLPRARFQSVTINRPVFIARRYA